MQLVDDQRVAWCLATRWDVDSRNRIPWTKPLGHKRIGALAWDRNEAQTEVQSLQLVHQTPLDLLLLMGILRAVHAHQDLPREYILRALTDVLP